MSRSEYVCARCGWPVASWVRGWRHAGNHHLGRTPCRTAPSVVLDKTTWNRVTPRKKAAV